METPDARLDRLRREHAPAITRWLTHAGVGDDVDDVLQSVFFKLRRELERQPIDEREVQGWLLTVARNEARDLWRKRCTEQRYKAQLLPAGDRSRQHSVEARLIRSERIKRLLRSLTPQEHGLIVLRYVDGLTIPEIADQTGLPFATVKGRLDRAITKMRRDGKEAEAS